MKRTGKAVAAAAIATSIAVAVVEIVLAGFVGGVLGWASVLALMLTVGIALGCVFFALVTAIASSGELERATEAIAAVARALIRPAEPAVEHRRVATAIAAVAGVGFALLVLRTRAPAAIALVGTDPWAAMIVSLPSVIGLLVVVALLPAVRRAALAGVSSLGALGQLRVFFAAIAVAVLVGVFVTRRPLGDLIRAIDLDPFIAIGFGLATSSGLFVFLLGTPRGRELASRVCRWPVTVGVVLMVAALWLLALGPASHDDEAIRLYRQKAPLSKIAARHIASLLDTDGDGYSSVLGDRDCAPNDKRRNPGAVEIAGNGIDDDCFDGDLAKGAKPFAPPPPTPRPANLPDKPNIVWIVADTLRPDHLGFYGHHRPTSPNLDRYAEKSTVFEVAYAPSSYTFAAMPAIWTGLLPNMLPAKLMRKRGKVPEDTPLIAELLGEAGYRTAIISGENGVLGQIGLTRGFERKRTLLEKPGELTSRAIAQLEEALEEGVPLFLVPYYFTTHSPYTVTDEAPTFGDSFEERYDHEIARLDFHVGKLLDRIEQPDLRDNTIVVFMSDHGEAFGEHGTYYHGHNLYDENVRAPLLFRVPGAAPSRAGGGAVSLIDIVPTVLNLAGVPIPEPVRGHDLTGAILGAPLPADRVIFMQSHFTGYGTSLGYFAAVATATHKLIEYRDSRTTELFDLRSDPDEKNNVLGSQPEKTLELKRALRLLRSYTRRK